MAEVLNMPGVFRPTEDLRAEPAEVLRSAMDAGLRDVVVIGRAIGGDLIIWSSAPDADTAIGLMTRGINDLASSNQVS